MPLDNRQREAFRKLAGEIGGIDLETYARFHKDPLEPIIGLGRPEARIGFLGRDPGRDEVKYGEPFIGAGGQLVRQVLYRWLHAAPLPDFEASRAVGRSFFWINTVPYKPAGNKAWSMKIKRRFHPLMMAVLAGQWRGQSLITLGREAFLWFGIGQSTLERQRIEAFWRREDRFETWIEVAPALTSGVRRSVSLYPLPHPSPLNATWYARFPALLRQRLAQLDVRPGHLKL